MSASREQGSATAEWAVGVVATTGAALVLCSIILSEWFEDQLYRPFVAAMSVLF